MNALKCKEHFERTLVRPVGRSAGLREVNTRNYLKEKINYPQINADEHRYKRFKLLNISVHLRLSVDLNSF